MNVIDLRPNSLIDTPFRHQSGWTMPVILAGVVHMIAWGRRVRAESVLNLSDRFFYQRWTIPQPRYSVLVR